MLESGADVAAARRCAVVPARDAMRLAAYVPIASTSGLASAATYTTVRGVTRKLSVRETSIVAGFGTTEYATVRSAGAGRVMGVDRQAASANPASANEMVGLRLFIDSLMPNPSIAAEEASTSRLLRRRQHHSISSVPVTLGDALP
jgi:hypothetical protein